jgi:integrase
MRGHVYHRKRPDGSTSRWYAVIDLPASSTGQRRQQTTSHDTKREAHVWLAQRVQELRAGQVYDSKVTVGQFLDSWLAGRRHLRPSTAAEYARHIRLHLTPVLGHLRLLDLRAHHIEAMFTAISAANDHRERPIGPTTLRRIYATLNSALNNAARQGLIRSNPASTVTLPQLSPRSAGAWTPEQAHEFLALTAGDELGLLYRVLILTGLRRGEAIGLRWGDLDLTAGRVSVCRQVTCVNGDLVTGPPKSKAGGRTIALDTTTLVLLQQQRRHAQLRQDPDAGQFEDTPVFTRPDGTVLHPAYVSRHFTSLVRRHGLPVIRLHDLRHTSASIGLAAGETLLEVSRRLGHSSITITADTYAHITPATAHASAHAWPTSSTPANKPHYP